MAENPPKVDESPREQTAAPRVARSIIRGAWVGAGCGIVLVLVLRAVHGSPVYFLPKSVLVVCIVAGFGAFVGTLADARQR